MHRNQEACGVHEQGMENSQAWALSPKLRLVVALISFCTVVICVMTVGTEEELHPTQKQQ